MVFKFEHKVDIYLHADSENEGLLRQIVDNYNLGERIMSKLTDFVQQQNAFNDQLQSKVDSLKDTINGLHQQINDFQNSPDEISDTDQASLDAILQKSQSLVDEVSGLSDTATSAPDTGAIANQGDQTNQPGPANQTTGQGTDNTQQ